MADSELVRLSKQCSWEIILTSKSAEWLRWFLIRWATIRCMDLIQEPIRLSVLYCCGNLTLYPTHLIYVWNYYAVQMSMLDWTHLEKYFITQVFVFSSKYSVVFGENNTPNHRRDSTNSKTCRWWNSAILKRILSIFRFSSLIWFIHFHPPGDLQIKSLFSFSWLYQGNY